MLTMNYTFPKSKFGKWPSQALNPSSLILGLMCLKNCAILLPKIASITSAHEVDIVIFTLLLCLILYFNIKVLILSRMMASTQDILQIIMEAVDTV